MNKKGFSVMDVPTLALTLGVVAIVIGLMATVLTNMQTTQDGNSDYRFTVSLFDANDTFTANTLLAVDVAGDHSSELNFVADSCTNVKVYNASNKADVTSAFTIANCDATLKVASALINKTVVTANYTYSIYQYGYSFNITDKGLASMEDLSDWQPTWVVIIASAVVVGIVGAYLFFRPK